MTKSDINIDSIKYVAEEKIEIPISDISNLKTDQFGMITCNIAGWMHFKEAEAIWNSIVPSINCLELGTYHGLSTSIIASRCYSLNAKLTTVDVFPDVQKIAKKNLTNTPIADLINWVVADSNEWVEKQKIKWDWVFIDHNHSLEYMDQTMETIISKLSKKHLVLLHDCHLPGVASQIPKLKNFRRVRNLGIGTLW